MEEEGETAIVGPGEIIAVSSDDATEHVMTFSDGIGHTPSTESESMAVKDMIVPNIVAVHSENVGKPEMEDIVTNLCSESQEPAVVEYVESPEQQVTEVVHDEMQTVQEAKGPQIAEDVLSEPILAKTRDMSPNAYGSEPIEHPETQQGGDHITPQITIITPSEDYCEPYYARMRRNKSVPSPVKDAQRIVLVEEEVATEMAPEVKSTPGTDTATRSAKTTNQTTQQQIERYSSRQPEPSFASMTQEQRDRIYKTSLCSAAPLAHRVLGYQQQPSLPFSNMDENERQRRYESKMAPMDQSHEDNKQEKKGAVEPEPVAPREPQSFATSTTATNFSHMRDDERQRRFDAKIRQKEQNDADSRKKRGIRDAYADPAQQPSRPFSNKDERQRRYESKMAPMDQSHEDNNQEKKGAVEPEPVAPREPQYFATSTPATNFSHMSDDERQRRFDAKIRQKDQNDADKRKKRGIRDPYDDQAQEHQPQSLQQMQSHTSVETSKSEEFPQDEAAEQFASPSLGITTTADRGIAVSSDVEYGEYSTPPLVPDGELAVAIALDDDEEEQEEKFYAYAVEYDPDSKPPIYKNRRFRLYGSGGVCVLIILIVLVILVIGGSGSGGHKIILNTQAPTEAPTEAPSTQVENIYRTFFANEVNQLVYTPGTPHYRAAEWIMKEDPQRLAPDSARLLQRYIMAFLYFHTTNNEENQWRSCNRPRNGEDEFCVYEEFVRLDNDTITYERRPGRVRWLSSENECKWEGVLCGGGTDILGVNLSKLGRQHSFLLLKYQDSDPFLSLSQKHITVGQNLTGTLPTELAALPFLQQISFHYNQMEGTIPADYTGLRHLLVLEVHGNMLTGTIPDEFYKGDSSSSLVLFNVGENLLSGTLDTRIGQMTDLKGLHLYANNFKGNFPTEIGMLHSLTHTRFQGNNFNGTLPTQLGSLTRLSELWAHQNGFSGSIPSHLGNLTRCDDLRLWGNKMSGSIPDQIYNMTNLSFLSVREMSLTGTLSTLVGQLTKLDSLRVSTNQLTGPIPTEIRNLTGLKLVWLHLNQFTGSVPEEICKLVGRNGLEFLQADCSRVSGDSVAPNPCECCSACCNRDTEICLLTRDV